MAPFGWQQQYDDRVSFWNKVWGFDMSAMSSQAYKENFLYPMVEYAPSDGLLIEKKHTSLVKTMNMKVASHATTA
jgi:hypothetical protein